MTKKLEGGEVIFEAVDADGTSIRAPWRVKPGTTIKVTRKYPDGTAEERQIFPQASGGYRPVKGPFDKNDD